MRRLMRWMCFILLAAPCQGWSQDKGLDARDDQEERVRAVVEEHKHKEELLSRQPTSLDGGMTVNPLILDTILDNTFGLRFEERDAYFRILELAWNTQLSEQQRFARDFQEERRLNNPKYAKRKPEQFPLLADIVNYPDDYRGRPVTIHGTLRKLTRFDPGKNNREIQDVYEGWIYTDDSRARTPENDDVVIPTVVVFQGKPDGLDVGGDLTEEVRLTGYFFKLYRYEAQDRGWKAPLLLAGSIEWKKRDKPRMQPLGAEVYLFITLIVFVLGFVWWQGNRREMASAIHPAEVEFSQFPPTQVPRKADTPFPGLTEPHDS